MAKIQVNGKSFEVSTDKSLLDTCLALGFNIPYFCFHPALGSVGACRQCAVKKYTNAEDAKGRIIMSCMEPVVDGMIISVNDPDVEAFREAVIEGLMTNHPHDCPVCDEGGECHLQDMTVMTGHAYRRYEFRKRTHENQYLGPFLNHEMNRCIQCYRCLRFYRDYAGGKDFCVLGSGNRVYFGRHQDGILENEFSGNLAEVCPTGVFTDKPLKEHFTRKWDLTNSPSVCIHCSLGCNTLVSQRYGSVRRVLSRYNKDINGYFLCDRGRFGYDFINNPGRIKKVMIKDPGGNKTHKETSKSLTAILSASLKEKKLVGIGSPRASLESNFALESLVGKGSFFKGISRKESDFIAEAITLMKSGGFRIPSLKDIEKADAVFILGEDPVNSAPMLALAVRQASRNKAYEVSDKMGIPRWNDHPVREVAQDELTPLFIASTYRTKLEDIATGSYNAPPAGLVNLGLKIASIIDKMAPSPALTDSKLTSVAGSIADTLARSHNPLIITGFQTGTLSVLRAAANVATALAKSGRKPSLSIIFPESDSLGLGIMDGKCLDDLYEELTDNKDDTLIILENDIFTRIGREKADKIMNSFGEVVLIDHLLNETAGSADVLLPCGTFAESTGTIVNNEGRAQRYYRVLPTGIEMTDSWRWIIKLAKTAGLKKNCDWKTFDDVVNDLTKVYPFFSGIRDRMPDATFRFYNNKIARQTMRFSGRTAMDASINVSEPVPPDDPDSPLNFSMEGYKGITPENLVPYYWSPGWNSVQAMNKYTSGTANIDSYSNPGVLLFSEKSGQLPEYFHDNAAVVKPGKDELLIVPVSLIFGSDELSSSSGPVSSRVPKPFIFINSNDSKRLKAGENEILEISLEDLLIRAVVRINDSLPGGTGGLSVILSELKFTGIPAICKIRKTDSQ